jgi:hypothetical protein
MHTLHSWGFDMDTPPWEPVGNRGMQITFKGDAHECLEQGQNEFFH